MNQGNDRHQQGSQAGRNRQSRQGFAQQEDTSYRYAGSEGDDFAPGRGGQHLQGFERGQGREGEFAQRLGHGSPGMGGQPGYGFGQAYGAPQSYGGYESPLGAQFGARPAWDQGLGGPRGMSAYSGEPLSQAVGYQQAGNPSMGNPYGATPYMGNPYIGNQYIGTQSGYPGSGFQGAGIQGYGGGSLGGQSGYGPSNYGQPGFGPAYGQSAHAPGTSEFGAYGAGQYGYGLSGSAQPGYGLSPGQLQGQQAGQSQRGRGPKGYTRSDDRIKEDVCERLSDDYLVDASDVTIDVRQGVVTLSGTVDSRQLKHRIEDLVETSSGVKDIENRLTVRPQPRTGTQATGASGATTPATSGTGTTPRPS
jgi:hypothetical protein